MVQIPVPHFFILTFLTVKIQKISTGFEGGINGLNQLVVLVLPAGRHRTGLNTKKYNREMNTNEYLNDQLVKNYSSKQSLAYFTVENNFTGGTICGAREDY